MFGQPVCSPSVLELKVSVSTYTIAGISVHVYGLEQLPENEEKDDIKIDVSCLYLLSPRLCDHTYMAGIARTVLYDYYNSKSAAKRGLICVAFDQRNHGEREVNKLANMSWRDSNATHAPDMFSIYHGTQLDLSAIISYLPVYIFPTHHSSYNLTHHLVAGVSLGGHSAYLAILHEPRITAGVVVIGCPDYVRLMQHRAGKSRLECGVEGLLRSKEFPENFLGVVSGIDPAAIGVNEILRRGLLNGKKILTLSGGADTLVPYACGEPFLASLKEAYSAGTLEGELVDVVYPGIRHECTSEMVGDLSKFVSRCIEEDSGARPHDGAGANTPSML